MTKETSNSADEIINYKDFPHLSVRQLAFRIKQLDDSLDNPDDIKSKEKRKPLYALFLGAGASYKSGIKVSSQMMKYFKNYIFESECPEKKTLAEQNEWLENQEWYKKSENKYGVLFNRYNENRRIRQHYIETLVEKGKPSFGYLVLACLLINNYLDTILTTNFDDLAYIASVDFAGIRPIIYAYGILASEMRLSAARPKIFKLHGDYLYSDLINTEEEKGKMLDEYKFIKRFPRLMKKIDDLFLTDPNMFEEVKRISDEYGLIIVGFDGKDKTITDIFEKFTFRHGFIWCYWKDNIPSQEILRIVRDKNGRLVKIDGFDEMMDEIRQAIPLEIESIFDRLEAKKQELREIITNYKKEYIQDFVDAETNRIIQKENNSGKTAKEQALDAFYQALNAEIKGQDAEAENMYKEAIRLNPELSSAYYHLGNLAAKNPYRRDQAEEFYRQAIKVKPDDVYAHNRLGNLLGEDKLKRDQAEEYHRNAIKFNPNYSYAYFELANLLSKDKSRRAEAIELYNKAIDLSPDNAEFYNNLGFLLIKSPAHRAQAEKLFRKAIILKPDYAAPYYFLSSLLRRRGANDEALNYLEQALQNNVEYYGIYLNLAGIYKKLNKQPQVLEYAEKAKILLKPNNYYYLARFYSISDKPDETFASLKLAINFNPSFRNIAKTDIDLEWIRDDPRFQEIVGE
jgi:tetratricopeptide (TPR) repeat protein